MEMGKSSAGLILSPSKGLQCETCLPLLVEETGSTLKEDEIKYNPPPTLKDQMGSTAKQSALPEKKIVISEN